MQAISELDVVYAFTSVDANALNVICYEVLDMIISSFFVKSGGIYSLIWQWTGGFSGQQPMTCKNTSCPVEAASD